ncbi:MAG: CDP-alcohol phosphatidyltransferase family protein [Acidimicrobiales bacterium]
MTSSTKALFTDPANLITQVGVVLGTVAIYAALRNEFELAVLFLVAAFVADYVDGPVARGTVNRPPQTGELGGILDSVADVVCHSVAPAVILLTYGDLELYLLPVAAFFIVAGVARMTRNTVDGGFSETTYRGLSSDNNIVVLATVFLIEPVFDGSAFANILAVILVATGFLNLSTIPVPKVTGRGYYAIAIWTALVAAVLIVRLATAS